MVVIIDGEDSARRGGARSHLSFRCHAGNPQSAPTPRGDWQLLPWIFGRGRKSDSEHDRSAIPFVGRWKMLDNLRRTLSAPAIYLALLAGWLLPLDAAVVWTAFVVATFAIPAFIPAFVGIIPRRFGLSQRRHWYMVGADFALASLQLALLITLVASQACAWTVREARQEELARSGFTPVGLAANASLLGYLPPRGLTVFRRRSGV